MCVSLSIYIYIYRVLYLYYIYNIYHSDNNHNDSDTNNTHDNNNNHRGLQALLLRRLLPMVLALLSLTTGGSLIFSCTL